MRKTLTCQLSHFRDIFFDTATTASIACHRPINRQLAHRGWWNKACAAGNDSEYGRDPKNKWPRFKPRLSMRPVLVVVLMAHRALSTQPVFGGPVSFLRNLVYHVPEGGALKFMYGSSGILVYHNTLIAPARWMLSAVSNLHFRNNLILGRSETPEIFTVDTFTNYSTSDYNGFRPNDGGDFSFMWNSPPFVTRADFTAKREERKFKTLQAFTEATGQDTHSILIDYDVFQKVMAPDPADPRKLYKPNDFDFRLRPVSAAVDAGVRLPNINDGFTGRAPDLGAYETDRPIPHYGPRP